MCYLNTVSFFGSINLLMRPDYQSINRAFTYQFAEK